MGACGSHLSAADRLAMEASRKIDQTCEVDHSSARNKVKMLLLGAGESGKSTIFKQMKILYGQGFSDEEKLSFRLFIWSNVIEAMKVLCEAAERLGEAYKGRIECTTAFDLIMATGVTDVLTPRIGAAIAALWADPVIHTDIWNRRAEFQVIDTSPAFFVRVTDIARPDYTPTIDDILLSRVRTTGIVEERFNLGINTVVMFDVGGQRNERKKWIHCFDEVDSVLFVAALSTYDQGLFEDESTNRMVEAIELFDEICNSRWFVQTDMILFLNKRDLFEEKVQRVNIASIEPFRDYTGEPNSYDDGLRYFMSRFLRVNKHPAEKEIFVHVTCATDTSNISFTFGCLHEIILKQNLRNNLNI